MASKPWKPATSSSDHEDRRRREFNVKAAAGQIRVDNFEPETGIGKFDAALDTSTHALKVVVKGRYDFVDTDSKWSAEDKLAFTRTAKNLIEKNWSRQYRLACSRPGWTDLWADVEFEVRDEKVSEHLGFRVLKINPNESAGGGLVAGSPPYLALSNLTVEETRSQTNKEQIFSLKMRQIKEAVDAMGGFVPFAANSAEVTSAMGARMLPLVAVIRKVIDDRIPALKLYVYGSTGPADRSITLGLGVRRAEALAAFLRSKLDRSVADFIKPVLSTTVHNWISAELSAIGARQSPPFSGSNFSGAVLLAHVPKARTGNMIYDSKYIVLLHEFGHAIGLPDEYLGLHDSKLANQVSLANFASKILSTAVKTTPTERIAKQQGAMAKAMEISGTSSPIFVDTSATMLTTASIMAAGREIYPAHYLTIWSALVKMTSAWIDPSEWKIVPKDSAGIRAASR